MVKKKHEIPGGLTPQEAATKFNALVRSGRLLIHFDIPKWASADRPQYDSPKR